MDVTIRDLELGDWSRVAEIYDEGIRAGDATFETDVPEWDAWDAARHPRCRLVAVISSEIVGFAAVTPVSTRSVYAGVAEVMVYVAESHQGQGVGRRLMDALVVRSETERIWTLQASIFPENEASVAIHVAVGFRVVGTRERLGRFHDGRWRDVVLLERRSAHVGTE